MILSNIQLQSYLWERIVHRIKNQPSITIRFRRPFGVSKDIPGLSFTITASRCLHKRRRRRAVVGTINHIIWMACHRWKKKVTIYYSSIWCKILQTNSWWKRQTCPNLSTSARLPRTSPVRTATGEIEKTKAMPASLENSNCLPLQWRLRL